MLNRPEVNDRSRRAIFEILMNQPDRQCRYGSEARRWNRSIGWLLIRLREPVECMVCVQSTCGVLVIELKLPFILEHISRICEEA